MERLCLVVIAINCLSGHYLGYFFMVIFEIIDISEPCLDKLEDEEFGKYF